MVRNHYFRIYGCCEKILVNFSMSFMLISNYSKFVDTRYLGIKCTLIVLNNAVKWVGVIINTFRRPLVTIQR